MKKITFNILILCAGIISLQACKQSNAFSGNNGETPEITTHEHLTMATLYQQTAAEYRALCYQAFNIAKIRVDESSKMLGGMKQKAIVVDVDETVLDNSPFEAHCILENVGYPNGWDEWMNKSNAIPVPGALELLQYAKTKDIDVFYITNRKEMYREQTLKNLKELNFPNATDDHLMLKTESSSKKIRRDKVLETHNIIFLIGDNLNDFSEVFEKINIEERFKITNKLQSEFGQKFIVLPNAMYGEWEGALYNYDYGQSDLQKSELRHKFLKGF